jgi:hypothetical protein
MFWRPAPAGARVLRQAGTAALVALVAACSGDPTDPDPGPGPEPTDEPATVLIAGDVAYCSRDGDEMTAALLDEQEGEILVAGDMLKETGPGMSYEACYGPSWGRHLERTHVALGNLDYVNGSADAAFDYFGDRAGPRGQGYYSLDIGSWHVVVLNGNDPIVSTAVGSPQEQWLRQDLAANADAQCVLAVWHQPRFYQGGSPANVNGSVLPFWTALYEAGADVVVNASFRLYERYAPQDPAGAADPDAGIRQFIVGTGGGGRDVLHPAAPNVESRADPAGGVLKLTLKPGGYDWAFLPIEGEVFTDTGSGTCH